MNVDILEKTSLFKGMARQEIENILVCLSKKIKEYKKNEIIYHAGDTVSYLGIVLSGCVSIEYNDIWGNKSVLDKLESSQVFAQTYACLPNEPLMVDVVANEACKILFIKVSSITENCSRNCLWHNKIMKNLLMMSVRKNFQLSQRIFHNSSKTIRGRLLSFLSMQSTKHGQAEFNITFNRQQLADYLNVDRSALSNEISKMQKEGLILVRKNHFRLLCTDFAREKK